MLKQGEHVFTPIDCRDATGWDLDTLGKSCVDYIMDVKSWSQVVPSESIRHTFEGGHWYS